MNSQSLFKQHFNYSAVSSSEAHGRVNLIGEHTDYNNGFVLPTLIEQKIEVSLGPRLDTQIVGISEEFGEKTVLSDSKTDGTWIDFVRGALHYMTEEGQEGRNAEIPRGAGEPELRTQKGARPDVGDAVHGLCRRGPASSPRASAWRAPSSRRSPSSKAFTLYIFP